MASKLAALQVEETKLNEIKEKLKDQLRRLQVEELALRSMLQSKSSEECSIIDVNSFASYQDQPSTSENTLHVLK